MGVDRPDRTSLYLLTYFVQIPLCHRVFLVLFGGTGTPHSTPPGRVQQFHLYKFDCHTTLLSWESKGPTPPILIKGLQKPPLSLH